MNMFAKFKSVLKRFFEVSILKTIRFNRHVSGGGASSLPKRLNCQIFPAQLLFQREVW